MDAICLAISAWTQSSDAGFLLLEDREFADIPFFERHLSTQTQEVRPNFIMPLKEEDQFYMTVTDKAQVFIF